MGKQEDAEKGMQIWKDYDDEYFYVVYDIKYEEKRTFREWHSDGTDPTGYPVLIVSRLLTYDNFNDTNIDDTIDAIFEFVNAGPFT